MVSTRDSMIPTRDFPDWLPDGALPTRVRPTEQFVRFEKAEVYQSIPDRFEKQVDAHADRVAVGTKWQSFTYGELNHLANRIARSILAASGEAEEPVALFLGGGTSALASILGVLKSGKFFVPLDPAQPEARNRYMLKDSEARIVLTDDRNWSSAANLAEAATTLLNVGDMGSSVPSENLGLSIHPDAIAYILYTSGSTGNPKGVVQSHKNVLHCAMRLTNDLHVFHSDRLAFLLSITHSAGLVDIFGALLNGAALFPFDVREEGLTRLANWLRENEITVAHMVPTLFRHVVLSLPEATQFPHLRAVKLSGEQVSLHEVELYRRAFPDHTLLFNAYGATEINAVRHFFMNQTTQLEGSVVPAGYETEDIEISILDDDGQEAGVGCVGEIVIRSPYISPGYWHKPKLNEATFLPDPEHPNGRLYKTGDIGYLNPDGCLFHLGRKDLQVKVRGHRIEPAEIEMALLRHHGVRECVVVARDGVNGEKQLVAYVVPVSDQSLDALSIRSSLKAVLPSYMIPAAFVQLDGLPLTATGKIDRLSLPVPDSKSIRTLSGALAPRDEVEEQLVAIWEELLRVHPIGVKDDFFDLGGDSLLTTQLVIAIEERFGKEIPPSALLEGATVENLADVLRHECGTESLSPLVPIRASGSRPPLYFIHGIGGGVLHYRLLASYLSPDQPVFGLQAHGTAIPSVPSIEDMASDYVRVIRGLQTRGPYYLGGYSAGGTWAFEVARQLWDQGQEVGLLALIDTPCPTRGKLLPTSTRILYHLSQMRSQGMEKALPYILQRLKTIRNRLGVKSHKLAYDLRDMTARPLPPSLSSADRITRIAYDLYGPSIYSGQITLLWTSEDTVFTTRFKSDPRLGWRDFTELGLEFHAIPGDHLSVMAEPHVRVLAEKLDSCLLKAQAKG